MRWVVVALLLASPSVGDEILLLSGGRLSGEVIEETASRITVRLPHGTIAIPRSKVARIIREKRSAYLAREGAASLRAGSTRNAVAMLGRAYEENPDDAAARRAYVGALLAHARALRAEFKLAEAYALLQRLLAIEPDHDGAGSLARELRGQEQRSVRLHNRAAAAYERGDYDTALSLFDAWRLQRPVGDEEAKARMATVHLAAGEADFERGALRGALDHFRSASSYGAARESEAALFVLSPVAVLEALKQGGTQHALRLIDAMAGRYPDRAVPVFLRAVAHHVGGDVEKALREYAEAARLAEKQEAPGGGLGYELIRRQAAGTLRAAIARPPREGQQRWRELFLRPLTRYDGARHFVVYAPTRNQAEEIGRAADALYERIARELLGALPSAAKAELVLHPGRQAYVAADPNPPGSPGPLTLPRTSTGGVTYDALGPDGEAVTRIETVNGARRLLQDTLPHEIVHVVQHRGLAAFRRAHWFDEGLAMLYESMQGRRWRLSQLTGQRLFPLAELTALRSTPLERSALFYNQAYALVAFVHELGTVADWRRFLDAFGRKGFEPALAEVYSIRSLDLLERRWLKSRSR